MLSHELFGSVGRLRGSLVLSSRCDSPGLGRGSGLMTKPLKGIGLDLVRPDSEVLHARRGSPTATLRGAPGEITLFLSGRGAAAHVEVGGPPEAVERVRGARFGL